MLHHVHILWVFPKPRNSSPAFIPREAQVWARMKPWALYIPNRSSLSFVLKCNSEYHSEMVFFSVFIPFRGCSFSVRCRVGRILVLSTILGTRRGCLQHGKHQCLNHHDIPDSHKERLLQGKTYFTVALLFTCLITNDFNHLLICLLAFSFPTFWNAHSCPWPFFVFNFLLLLTGRVVIFFFFYRYFVVIQV